MTFRRHSDFPGSGRGKGAFYFPTFFLSAPPIGARKWKVESFPQKKPADKLTELVSMVARLSPDRDPEAFHVQKSEIIAPLRRLASEAAR